jgi:exonuclease VII large subunit
MSIWPLPSSSSREGAASEIARIEYFNQQKEVEVIIVARGGSLEDLWAFNEEKWPEPFSFTDSCRLGGGP